jgi:signal transduction histidine kinase
MAAVDKEKLNLLIIEDEDDVRSSYEDMFEFLDCDIASARNGKEGLHILEQRHNSIDVVITDLNMPIMDGLEVIRRVKKKYAEIEVIIITGFATIENAISAMKQGAFDYITKPISVEHVKIVLNKCRRQIISQKENKRLKNINSELQTLNELKTKFITITNHEIRTPLAVLKGYLDLISMDIKEHDLNDSIDSMKIIDSTLNEMIEMLDNMHDLSKYDTINDIQNITKFDVNELCREIVKQTHIFLQKRKLNLTINTSTHPAIVEADKLNIKKAIRELLQNAVKFTDENGSIQLDVEPVPTQNSIFVKISDTGIGVACDKQDLIFEPFYEVQDVMHHSTSKTDFMGGGMGVGLSIAKEIIESNKGEIVIESMPNRGAVFTIILPEATK